MAEESIKSRPIYKGLIPDASARPPLIIAEGEGAEAVAELAAKSSDLFLARAIIFYVVASPPERQQLSCFEALGVAACYIFPTIAALLIRLDGVLATATMGTRLYVTGTEGFIGQVVQIALSHGIDQQSIFTEHRGSLARRVQCVHCKGFMDGVKTNLVKCGRCGISLLVRDHYSRRLGAFMGVSADAEVSGDLPPLREIFP
jgi:dimethylamine monooxygenase subunit C